MPRVTVVGTCLAHGCTRRATVRRLPSFGTGTAYGSCEPHKDAGLCLMDCPCRPLVR